MRHTVAHSWAVALTTKVSLFAPLIILSLFVGCSTTAWKEAGQPGPWCAPDTMGHVLYRTVNFIGMPNPQGEMALVGKSGAKQSSISFWHELDEYFSKCSFIDQWPTHGTVGSIPSHRTPFDMCLVSMNPTVIVGVERQNPKVSAFWPLATSEYAFIGSTYLVDAIAVGTTLPYHPGAKVIWFSPAIDNNLHEIDVVSGTASLTIGKGGRISVAVDGAKLTTLRR